jgi:hypothetical protein
MRSANARIEQFWSCRACFNQFVNACISFVLILAVMRSLSIQCAMYPIQVHCFDLDSEVELKLLLYNHI